MGVGEGFPWEDDIWAEPGRKWGRGWGGTCVWGERGPGSGNSMCKGPEAGRVLRVFETQQEPVAGARWAEGEGGRRWGWQGSASKGHHIQFAGEPLEGMGREWCLGHAASWACTIKQPLKSSNRKGSQRVSQGTVPLASLGGRCG